MGPLNLTFPPSNISSSANDQSVGEKIKDCCGHGVSVISKGFSMVSDVVLTVAQKVINSLKLICEQTPSIASVARKLDHHVLRFFEHVRDVPGALSKCAAFLRANVAFIDFMQLVSDVDYFARGKFKEKLDEKGEIKKPRDNPFMIGGKFFFLAADVGGALLWFQEMGFFALKNAAAAIGEIRIFGLVPKVVSSIPVLRDVAIVQKVAQAVGEFRVFGFVKNFGCGFVTLRALDLAYACFAVDAGRRIINAANAWQTVSASLDLSSYLSELTLSAAMLLGVTNVVALGVGGATCIALAMASFLFRTIYSAEIKNKAPSIAAQA